MLACVAVLPMVVTAVLFHQVAVFELSGWALGWLPPAFGLFTVTSTIAIYATGLWLEHTSSRCAAATGLVLFARPRGNGRTRRNSLARKPAARQFATSVYDGLQQFAGTYSGTVTRLGMSGTPLPAPRDRP